MAIFFSVLWCKQVKRDRVVLDIKRKRKRKKGWVCEGGEGGPSSIYRRKLTTDGVT